ncbi:HD-GYP domain-containing protein [Xylanibacillus composti]|uniref:HD family phosphohydrolase n=1 Tax=Xylanibacillus composti TaxID=1572762 RepID=A0A8J4H5E8_9BACL|nr:HD-GYP domain-containing protein [Xylanibacillus composti]MDT9725717.1 HD-GYP domain-containing protein [Xylanibacillus composti]GIQ71144.1 HD family phosphohydrolase [Xylanibacillus composti]
MEKRALSSQQIMGRRILRDIFNAGGLLLISAHSIISTEHIQILERHGITLTSQDVAEMGTYSEAEAFEYGPVIQEAVVQARRLFHEIRETREIPLADLRKNVIPIIQEAARTQQLFGLFACLQAKDDYTYRHNIAVGTIASLLGIWLKLPQQELMQLATAGLLHDVGKMLVPEEVLNKPGKLTGEEYEIMKSHTVLGYGILRETVGVNHRQALVALQHHERMDGSGYPFGLTQERIDAFSRIVSVADVFHAMTSKRVYRHPAPFYEVLSQMEKDIFGVLDPVVTRLFIEKIMQSLIGHSVRLTDESEGIILTVHPHNPTRPLVQAGSRFVDLSQDLSLHIQQIL